MGHTLVIVLGTTDFQFCVVCSSMEISELEDEKYSVLLSITFLQVENELNIE